MMKPAELNKKKSPDYKEASSLSDSDIEHHEVEDLAAPLDTDAKDTNKFLKKRQHVDYNTAKINGKGKISDF